MIAGRERRHDAKERRIFAAASPTRTNSRRAPRDTVSSQALDIAPEEGTPARKRRAADDLQVELPADRVDRGEDRDL